MTRNLIIIALVIVIIYLYYQQKKPSLLTGTASEELTQTKQANQTLVTFLRDQLNSNSLEELKTKLGEKTLDEILEENEDYETEVDTLTRTKNSFEKDLAVQANAFQARQREKDREIKKLKEDFTSEKQQHKGSLERIKLLTEQITSLEKQFKKMPGEFPESNLKDETEWPPLTKPKK